MVQAGYNRPPKRLVSYADGPTIDAFGRLRTSDPYTVFDSQMEYNTLPLFWSTTTATGGSATHLPNESAVRMRVDGTNNASVIRQTKRYFRYQPGKSQRILMTVVIGAATTNVRKRVGYFDARNGLFFEQTSAGIGTVKRTYTTGSAGDTRVEQADWNLDRLDGTGPSGITLDVSKAQIFLIDLEWLGVGRVRYGVVIDGNIIYCHELNHANSVTTVYMTTANLPLRYEITRTGAGAGNTDMLQICSEISSEGGVQERNLTFGHTMTASRSANSTGLPILSIKVANFMPSANTTNINRETVIPMNVSIYSEDAAIAYWLVFNPNLTGMSWVNANGTHSGVQIDKSATSYTGGTIIDGGGYVPATVQSKSATTNQIDSSLFLVNNTAGNSGDILTIVVRRLTATASDTWAAITWKELY